MNKLVGIFFILVLSTLNANGQEQIRFKNFNFNKIANFIEKKGIITYEQGAPVDHFLRINFEKKKYFLILIQENRHNYFNQARKRGITGWYQNREENHSFVLDKDGIYLMDHSCVARKNIKKMLIFLNEQAELY